jgi:hypothetical protein
MEQTINNQREISRYEEVLSVNGPIAALAFTSAILAWFGFFSWTTFLMPAGLGLLFAFEISRTWKKQGGSFETRVNTSFPGKV